jgi:fimbrial isopeptide formation D2 family protein/uncharacterized repeat protein (TIGR01451 family)
LPIPNYFTITTNSSDVEETTVTSNTAYAEMIQPKKTINGDTKLVTEVGIGDTVTYAIEQEVHDIDVDHLTKYRAFSFSDTLPEYVVYKENSYKVTDSEGHEVPSDAGSFSYDKNTNTVKYEFNDNYLQNGMIYNGHAYKFEFQVTVVDQPDDDLATIDNYATVQANDLVEKTNVVSYTPISPVLQIEKHADLTNNLASAINEFEYLSHDQHADQFSTVHYIGSFQNTADKTRAKNVTMTDELPIGLSLVPGSVTATGADGIEITEDTVNNKIIITVTELDPWSPVTFSYDCYTTDEGNGKEIVNVADVWATNVQLSNPGSEDNHARDDGEIYINDPTIKLTKTVTESLIQNEDYQDTADHQREEYRVDDTFTYTVTMVNTTPGTFGRNVYLTDQDLPEGFELVGGLNVTGLTNNGKNKTLFYPMAGVSDSIHGEGETREINWSYTTVEKEDGTWGWELNLDYLPYNYPITVSWTVKATAETNGWEVYNQAYATAENQPGDTFYSDEPIVWINTPEFNVDKQVRKTDQAYQVGDVASYDVTLYGLKTPGTLARQTTLEDNFLQDGTTIIENSFVITDQQSNARDISSQVELNRYVGDQYWHIDMTQVYNDSTGYWVCSENYRYIWQDGVLIMVDSEKNPVGADAHDYMNVNYQATINDMALQNYYVENLATADSIEGFPGEDEATVTVIGPQLDINKTSYDGGSFVEGDIAAYEVTIRNLATGTLAEDVQITDGFTTAKAGAVAIVEGSIKLYDNQNNEITNFEVSYNTNEAGNIIGFGIDTNYNLAGGDKITLRYNVKYLTNNGSNVVKNVAKTWADNAPSVSDYYETWPSDNDQSDLIIDKGSDKQVYKQGDTGTYTLHITNQNANQVAENVVINDKITLDTLGIASVVKGSVKIWNSQGQGVSGKVTYTQAHGGQVNGFNIETGYDLASTDWLDVEYTVSFNANVTQATQIHNTCWASADNTGKATDENDVLVDSNRFTTPDEPEKEPETPVNPISPINPDPVTPSTPDDPEKSNPLLKIVKQSDKTQYETGDTATYTLRVNNTVEGSNPAKNVVITDHLDAASQNLAVIQKGSVKAISGNGQTISIKDISYSTNSKGETVGFTILTNYDLEYDDSIFVTYTATINEDIDASTSIVNKAYASADNASQVTDDNTVEVPVQGTNPEQPTSTKPNLEINKVASKTTATVGSPLTWTITVKQTVEGAQAANTVLEDEIPQGFTLSIDGVSVKDAEGNTLDKTWTITDRKLSVNLGDIAYNKPVIVTLVGNIDSEYEGKTMENTAVATSTNVDEPVQSTAKVTISNENTGNPDSPENDTDTPTSGTNTPTSGTNTTTPTSGSTVGSSGTKATSGTSGTTSGSSSKGLDQTGDMIISWAQDNWAALLGGVAVTVLGIWGASRFVKNED